MGIRWWTTSARHSRTIPTRRARLRRHSRRRLDWPERSRRAAHRRSAIVATRVPSSRRRPRGRPRHRLAFDPGGADPPATRARLVVLENHEREYAFGEAEVRLLQTIAASMGVALENARLFDETQRLLRNRADATSEDLQVHQQLVEDVRPCSTLGILVSCERAAAGTAPEHCPGSTGDRSTIGATLSGHDIDKTMEDSTDAPARALPPSGCCASVASSRRPTSPKRSGAAARSARWARRTGYDYSVVIGVRCSLTVAASARDRTWCAPRGDAFDDSGRPPAEDLCRPGWASRSRTRACSTTREALNGRPPRGDPACHQQLTDRRADRSSTRSCQLQRLFRDARVGLTLHEGEMLVTRAHAGREAPRTS